MGLLDDLKKQADDLKAKDTDRAGLFPASMLTGRTGLQRPPADGTPA